MKLLVGEFQAFRHYVSRECYYVMRHLVDEHGWTPLEMAPALHDPTPLAEQIRRRFGRLPAVVLFWGGDGFITRRAGEIAALPCHKCLWTDDLHRQNDHLQGLRRSSYLLCDTLFATYAYVFAEHFPDVAASHEVVWVPHAASVDFLLPLNAEPRVSILLSGALSDHYPLRLQLKELHDAARYPIEYVPHPGYGCNFDYGQDRAVGRGYARRIHAHLAAFTDALRYRYLVAKYFEIPATGALLLADDSVGPELRQLGFEPGVHYRPVSADDLEEQVRWVLDERHRDEVDAMRARARRLVESRHTTAHRARTIDRACAAAA